MNKFIFIATILFTRSNSLQQLMTDTLVPYWIRIWEKHKSGVKIKDDEYYNLINLPMSDTALRDYDDFLDLFEDYLRELRISFDESEQLKQTFTIREWKRDNDENTIEGVFSKGTYGRPGDHLDRDAARNPDTTVDEARIENARGKTISDETRYYFLLHIPANDVRRAVLILHSYGKGSVKTQLQKGLYQKLIDIKSDIRIRLNPIVGGSLFEKAQSYPIKGFEIAKRKVPPQKYLQESDELGNNVKDSTVTFTINASSDDYFNFSRGRLRKMIENEEYPFVEVLDTSEVDRANLLIEKNGRTRRLNISKDKPIMETEILEDKIKYDAEGWPKMTSIALQAREVANESLIEYGYEPLQTSSSLLENDD